MFFQDIQINTSDPNIYINVFNIIIKPNLFALIDYEVCCRNGNGAINRQTIKIEGDDYKMWEGDDRYLFVYLANKHGVKYVEKVEPEFLERRYCKQNPDGSFTDYVEQRKNPNYTGRPPLVITQETIMKNADGEPLQTPYVSSTADVSDMRSVHNEADIARIQTLQEQLDEQAKKLKTITELLFKNGAI